MDKPVWVVMNDVAMIGVYRTHGKARHAQHRWNQRFANAPASIIDARQMDDSSFVRWAAFERAAHGTWGER